MLKTLEELLEFLPSSFGYAVTSFEIADADETFADSFYAELRTDLGERDWKRWLTDFSERSKTQWVVSWRNTHDESARNRKRIDNDEPPKRSFSKSLFSARVLCQHTDRNKNRKSESSRKGCGCNAYIRLSVQAPSRRNLKNRHYIAGLTSTLIIDFTHNHPIGTPEALAFLSPPTEVRAKFEEYFRDFGMGIAESLRYHEALLRHNEDFYEEMLIDRSIQPHYNTVQEWYRKWKQGKGLFGDGPQMVPAKRTALSPDVQRYVENQDSADEHKIVEDVSSADTKSVGRRRTVEHMERPLERLRRKHQQRLATAGTSSVIDNDSAAAAVEGEQFFFEGDDHQQPSTSAAAAGDASTTEVTAAELKILDVDALDAHDYSQPNVDDALQNFDVLANVLRVKVAQFGKQDCVPGLKEMVGRAKAIQTPEMLTEFFLSQGAGVIPGYMHHRRRPRTYRSRYFLSAAAEEYAAAAAQPTVYYTYSAAHHEPLESATDFHEALYHHQHQVDRHLVLTDGEQHFEILNEGELDESIVNEYDVVSEETTADGGADVHSTAHGADDTHHPPLSSVDGDAAVIVTNSR